MEQHVLELLLKKLEERRKEFIDSLGEGAAKDYASYKELCGVSRGLLLAQFEINNLLQRLKEEDE
tara:strand:+ start:2787 stop:2981 length:195 start_codon:yes stop_codon:yes gene_type:complete